ncbi:hypothetical protein PENTCL1PPCAC_16977, partial [Pristionchus entomophagus]
MEMDKATIVLAELYTFLVLTGCITNSLIIAATVSSKMLHSTCNVLIAFFSFADIVHMTGQIPKILWILSGRFYMSSYLCNAFQALPLFGLSTGTFGVLSLGLDRLIWVFFRSYYTSKNSFRYL